MDEAANTNDKLIFAVSFLTLLVTLSNYKNSLSQIKLNIFSESFSVFTLLTYIVIVLFISVYLSAIEKLRYNTLLLSKSKILEVTGIIADILYIFAILIIPISFLAFYCISCIFSGIAYLLSIIYIPYFSNQFSYTSIDLVSITTAIVSFIAFIIQTIEILKLRRKNINDAIEEASNLESDSIVKANKAYLDGYYEYMLIELNNVIENKIYAKLVEKRNLKRDLLSPRSMIDIAVSDGIVNTDQKRLIEEIRSLRNRAAHGTLETPLNENYAKELLAKTKNFVSKL